MPGPHMAEPRQTVADANAHAHTDAHTDAGSHADFNACPVAIALRGRFSERALCCDSAAT